MESTDILRVEAMFFYILLGIVMLAGIVYLAVSRKSSKMQRFAALCALAVMVLSVIISLFIIFSEDKSESDVYFLLDATPPEEPAIPDIVTMLLFILFFVAFFVVVLLLSMREQKRNRNP